MEPAPEIKPFLDTFTLHGNKLLIQRDQPGTVTEAGIVVPEGSMGELKTGVIVKLGTHTEMTDYIHSAGERIQWEDFKGVDITIHGEDFIILKPEDVLITIHD